MKTKTVVVFDLDDTLYNEIDFLKSAYKEISANIALEANVSKETIYNEMLEYFSKKENVFEEIIVKYNSSFSITELLSLYRNHKPQISLTRDKLKVLNFLKSKNFNLALLTDGRSVQQRNKIQALNLTQWFSEIVISEEFGSEKPNVNNYKYFEDTFGDGNYYYIADNIYKDFISPNKLKWKTVCLKDNGLNIHKQKPSSVSEEYLAKYTINEFKELTNVFL